ncbi:MAG: GAF domain-containing protein [SAR324 cluster bacterium]|nr:GAF domain-containing protein [SAR324 cluster bacterium]
MTHSIRFDLLFPYAIAPLLTLVVSIFLVSLTIRVGKHVRENQLFTLLVLNFALYNLDLFIRTLLTSPVAVLTISRLQHISFVYFIPLLLHFSWEILGIRDRKKTLYTAYGFSAVIMLFTQSEYYLSGVNLYFFGYFSQSGPLLKIYATVALAVSIYALWLLVRGYQKSSNREERLKLKFVISGVFSNAFLTLGNLFPTMGIAVYPPGNLGFIPLLLMAYGILQHNILDTAKSWFYRGYVPRVITGFVWLPTAFCLLFLLFSGEGVFPEQILDKVFPWLIPSLLSCLVSLGLASFSFLKGKRDVETLLFGVLCTLWGWLSLDKIMEGLFLQELMALRFTRFAHFFLVYQLGVYTHLVYSVTRNPDRLLVRACYVASVLLMFLTQTTHYYQDSMYQYFFGYFGQGNWAFQFFGGVGLALILWNSVLLFRAWRKTAESAEKIRLVFLFTGTMITAVLNLGNIPATKGVELYPLGNFSFVAILIMAYGIFRHDILEISDYAREKTLRLFSLGGLGVIYAALLIAAGNVIAEYSFFEILAGIYPYGIPPLISFLMCLFLSFVSIRAGYLSMESILFSLICVIYGFLSMEILLTGIVFEPEFALKIIRLDHFFLVYMIGLNVHLSYRLAKRHQENRWIIYFFYAVSVVLSLFTQTDWYIQEVTRYYWGFYPRQYLMFNVFCVFLAVGLVVVCRCYYQAWRQSRENHQKRTFLFFLGGSLITMLLNLGDIPAVYGIEIYPLGNFSFLAVGFMAYGLLNRYIQEVLYFTRSIIHQFVFLLLLMTLVIGCYITLRVHTEILSLIIATLAVRVLFQVSRTSIDAVLDLLFPSARYDMERVLGETRVELSLALTPENICDVLIPRFLYHLEADSCWIIFADKGALSFKGNIYVKPDATRKYRFSSRTRQTWPYVSREEVQINAEHPLVMALYEKQSLMIQEKMDEWLRQNRIRIQGGDILSETALVSPVFFQGAMACVLGLETKANGQLYSREEQHFLRAISFQLGSVIENVNLVRSLEERIQIRTWDLQEARNRLTHLNEVIQAVNSTLDLDEVMNKVMKALQEVFLFDQIGILLPDEEGENLIFHQLYGTGLSAEDRADLRSCSFPLDGEHASWVGECYQTRKPVYVSRIREDSVEHFMASDQRFHQVSRAQSYIFFPLTVQNHSIGVIHFGHSQLFFELSQERIESIQQYVLQIAAAIQNALQYEQSQNQQRELTEAHNNIKLQRGELAKTLKLTQRHEQELSRLYHLMDAANSSLRHQDILKAFFDYALEENYPFDGLMLHVLEPHTETLKLSTVYALVPEAQLLENKHERFNIPMNQTGGMFHTTLNCAKPQFIVRPEPDERPEFYEVPTHRHFFEEGLMASMLMYPLLQKNQSFGLLSFFTHSLKLNVTESRIATIERYVQTITSGLHNAYLYEQSQQDREEISRMNHLIRTVNATLDLDEVMTVFAEVLEEIFRFDQIGIWIVKEAEQQLELVKYYGVSANYNFQEQLSKVQMPLVPNHSLVCETLLKNRLSCVSPITPELLEAFTPTDRLFHEIAGAQAYLLYPLNIQMRTFGVLVFARTDAPFTLTGFQQQTIQRYVNQLANAMYNAELYEQSQKDRAASQYNALQREKALQELGLQHQQLQDAQVQLVQSEKMALLGSLVAGVAHEINTPAGAIQAAIQEIDQDYVELLSGMSQILRNLPVEQWDVYFQACQTILTFNQELTTREQRQIASGIQGPMADAGISEARVWARDLAMVGFSGESIPPFLPLFQSAVGETIQQSLRQLGLSRIHVRNIKIAVDRITQLVKAFKHHARLDSSQWIETDLKHDLENTMVILRNKWKHGIIVHREYAELPPVRCNADQLNQVWTNLIHNAIQAMNGKGELIIRLQRDQERVFVEIEDSGPGIPHEIQNRIFEPFFTTKAKGEGTGLGLSICKEIIERHQGLIRVDSVPGKTCFHVEIPLTMQEDSEK